MPLTIETGAGVAGADSYASVAEARAYASARGLTLPAADADVEKALVLACDKLETYRYKGTKTSASQTLQWPRTDVYVEDATEPLATNSIPARLKQAQCQLAFDSTQTELQPRGDGREVAKEKVDIIETEYVRRGSGSLIPEFNKAEDILKPLLASGGGFSLKTLRV